MLNPLKVIVFKFLKLLPGHRWRWEGKTDTVQNKTKSSWCRLHWIKVTKYTNSAKKEPTDVIILELSWWWGWTGKTEGLQAMAVTH